MKKKPFFGLFILINFVVINKLHSQSIWLDFEEQRTVALEILKPRFEGDETSLFTSVVFATVYIPINDKVRVIGELPLAHFGSDATDKSENTFGNPYAGLELHFPDAPFYAELGLRVPISPDEKEKNGNAALTGFFTELVDRMEAFVSDAMPITAILNYRHASVKGWVVRLRMGPSLWIATGKREDLELSLNYGAQTWFKENKLRLGFGLTGRVILSRSGTFNQRSVHQLGVNAEVQTGLARPGLYLRVPFDKDWSDIVSFVVGLKMEVRFRD